MKTGLVLEGGAYRGIFTTGVISVMKKNNIDFDYIVGVSAGAGNIADFVSDKSNVRQNYITISENKNAYGVRQLIKSGRLLNMDEVIKEIITNYEDVTDQFIEGLRQDIEIVCTNCITAKPEYLFDRENLRHLIEIAKASCAVPGLSNPIMLNGTPYLDGSVTDAIPLRRALEAKKCDKAVVILTRPVEDRPTDYRKFKLWVSAECRGKYPKLKYVLLNRLDNYMKQVAYINKMEEEGRAFVIRPTIPSIHRFEKNEARLQNYYIHGIDTMHHRMPELKKFLEV